MGLGRDPRKLDKAWDEAWDHPDDSGAGYSATGDGAKKRFETLVGAAASLYKLKAQGFLDQVELRGPNGTKTITVPTQKTPWFSVQ